MDKITKRIEEIRKFYYENDYLPFPYNDVRALQDDLQDEFKKYAPNEILTADLDLYWFYIAGLAYGGIEKSLEDALERYKVKNRLEKSFFDWFPKYRFFERYDISEFPDLDYNFKMYDQLRHMLLELINLYEKRIHKNMV